MKVPEETTLEIAEFIRPMRVRPGSKVNLEADFDPAYKGGFIKKQDGKSLLQQGAAILEEYQTRLAAQGTYGVVVCLQALDAAGKDGTIRHVMSGVDPQGVKVASFKVPSSEELSHDYPITTGSSSGADVRERRYWGDYQKAFSEMLSATSTEWAPWFVIPADRKWLARISVSAVLAHTLMELDPRYPKVNADQKRDLLEAKASLEAEAPAGADADPFRAKKSSTKPRRR